LTASIIQVPCDIFKTETRKQTGIPFFSAKIKRKSLSMLERYRSARKPGLKNEKHYLLHVGYGIKQQTAKF
jgi:hypothetical protein